jgi:hypothetical protein
MECRLVTRVDGVGREARVRREGAGVIDPRIKGKVFEQDTVRRWRALGEFDLRRQPNSGGLMWKGDLYGSSLSDLHIECKAVERLNIEACMDKARGERKSGQTVVLVHKRIRCVPLVTLEESDFVGMLKELMDYRGRDEDTGGSTDNSDR